MQNPSPTGGDGTPGHGTDTDTEVRAPSDPGEPAYPSTSDPTDHELYRRPAPQMEPAPTEAGNAAATEDGSTGGDLTGVPLRGDPDTRATLDALDLAGWSTRPMEPDPVPPYPPLTEGEDAASMHLPPTIGDYWPEAPGEPVEPHAAGPAAARAWSGRSLTDDLLYAPREDPPFAGTAQPETGAWPVAEPATVYGRRRRRGVVVAATVAMVLLAGAGIVTTVIKITTDPVPTAGGQVVAPAPPEPSAVVSTIPVQPTEPDGATPAAPAPKTADPQPRNVVTGPLGGRDAAKFDLVNGTTMVKIHLDALGDELYRVSTPEGASVLPRVVADNDRFRLFLVRSGVAGVGAVDITLNVKVRWDLRVIGGAEQSVIDLSGGRVDGVELAGGATRIDLTLPRPDGTLSVRMTGGVNQFVVRRADAVPVRVRVGSGAGRVVLDGRQRNGIAPGSSFTTARWAEGGDRIYLDAVAGMAALTVDRG